MNRREFLELVTLGIGIGGAAEAGPTLVEDVSDFIEKGEYPDLDDIEKLALAGIAAFGALAANDLLQDEDNKTNK